KQNALGFVPEQVLTVSTPLVRVGNTIACPTCVSKGGGSSNGPESPGNNPSSSSGNSTTSSATATFVGSDSTTMATWRGSNGAVGYNVCGDTHQYPGYLAASITAESQPVVWAFSTADVRALQSSRVSIDSKSGGRLDRVAAAWTTASAVSLDLNFADTNV